MFQSKLYECVICGEEKVFNLPAGFTQGECISCYELGSWRVNGPNKDPSCTCGCETCKSSTAWRDWIKCPNCEVHKGMSTKELKQEWELRNRGK